MIENERRSLKTSSLKGAIGWSLPAFIDGQIWFIIGFILAMFTPITRVAIRTLISQCVTSDEVCNRKIASINKSETQFCNYQD